MTAILLSVNPHSEDGKEPVSWLTKKKQNKKYIIFQITTMMPAASLAVDSQREMPSKWLSSAAPLLSLN